MKPLLNILLLFSLVALTACHKSDDAPLPPTPQKAQRTVLIYMAAQNSLGTSSNQLRDSMEIMAARYAVDDTDRLLFFMDDRYNPRIYQVLKDEAKPKLVHMWDEDLNSTSPETLRDVLTWTKQYYPAEEYGLVMWSHADGWLPSTDTIYTAKMRPFSFGIDDGDRIGSDGGTQMNVGDMARVISQVGIHAKYIFFDACLMQNLEVAYTLRNVADYIVAAPMAIPAAGGNYTHLIQDGLFAETPQSIAATYIADISDPMQTDVYGDFGLVISCIRTDRLQAVADALREALPHSALNGRTSPDMSGVQKYQAYTSSYYYRPHNYDARQALQRILPEEQLTTVLETLDAAIVYKAATERFWIGPGFWSYDSVDQSNFSAISLFVPQQAYTANAAHCLWGDLNTAFAQTEWYDAAGFRQTGW